MEKVVIRAIGQRDLLRHRELLLVLLHESLIQAHLRRQ
jgi:hypothetical protein